MPLGKVKDFVAVPAKGRSGHMQLVDDRRCAPAPTQATTEQNIVMFV